jgi:hypothetical protein
MLKCLRKLTQLLCEHQQQPGTSGRDHPADRNCKIMSSDAPDIPRANRAPPVVAPKSKFQNVSVGAHLAMWFGLRAFTWRLSCH